MRSLEETITTPRRPMPVQRDIYGRAIKPNVTSAGPGLRPGITPQRTPAKSSNDVSRPTTARRPIYRIQSSDTIRSTGKVGETKEEKAAREAQNKRLIKARSDYDRAARADLAKMMQETKRKQEREEL